MAVSEVDLGYENTVRDTTPSPDLSAIDILEYIFIIVNNSVLTLRFLR